GCNFFDTAWAYGDGHSEELLGKILRANQSNAAVGGPDKKLYVATKIPPRNRRWPSRREFSLDDCFPPDYIVEYVEKSLAVIARVPFDEGSLTGTLTLDSSWPKADWRSTYFVAENLKSSVAHADALKPLLRDGLTLPEMALRFIL